VQRLTRRQLLAAGAGVAGTFAAGGALAREIWPLLRREDLIPGTAPRIELAAAAWEETNGSGGRQAMAVATQLARAYQATPFGFVALLGDICYYGRFEDRFDDVFLRPMRPLIDAGVGFELAIGNHDEALRHSDESTEEIDAELRLLGTPGLYYVTSHGPADVFYLDSSGPGLRGNAGRDQLAWLDAALAASSARWKVVALHHPAHSSGRHGPTRRVRERVEPLLRRHRVDLVLAGHDHHYERSVPVDGITHVVSGGGCKTTGVHPGRTTAYAASILQFLVIDIDGDRLVGRCIRADGTTVDRFELRARAG
jgi:3',5'-cyclic AMP phosphodiesterase CpdA